MELIDHINFKLSEDEETFFSFLKRPDKKFYLGNDSILNEKELIHRHRLMPFFYLHRDKLDIKLQGYITHQHLQNTHRMLLFANEMFLISETCKQHHIHPLFLKGPALAYELHKNFAARQIIDLDIYFTKNDLNLAHKIFLDLGYLPTDIPKTSFRKFILKDRYYFHPGKKVSLEVHYRFFPNTFLNRLFKKTFTEITRPLDIQGKKITVLKMEASFIFLILHGANHQWFRLFWLKDLADFISKKEMDWKEIISFSKKLGINNALIQSILLTNIFFDTPIPLEIQDIIKNSKTEKWLLKKAVSAIVSPIDETFSTRFGRLIYLLKLCNKLPFKLNTLFGGVLRYLGK